MLRFYVHVALTELECVGPYGFFSPMTRLAARLASMDIVQQVRPAMYPTVVAGVPCHRIYIERKATSDSYDVFYAIREVEAEINAFIDQMAARKQFAQAA